MKPSNRNLTCWNCPSANLKGNVEFRACGQSKEKIKSKIKNQGSIMIGCSRRKELGNFEPTISFEQCPEWELNKDFNIYLLKNMRVLILGIDGYLGWTLALKLSSLGFKVGGIDNFYRRACVRKGGAESVVPISSMSKRLKRAGKNLGFNILFKRIDVRDRKKLKKFLRKTKPETIVHYGENPSAPYSMVSAEHAIEVQDNNVLGTLGLLFLIREICPEASLIKLGSMGEYGAPLTGRPVFEGIFPADATISWRGRKWSLGGEITPRDPVSLYHTSKVQDSFNVYETCKYWWLRSYDVMQGVIYGVHTDETSNHPELRTRFDIDEWYGTVVNRFVAQAILGMPLTVYGGGEQIRGFIALEDAMECMVRLIASPLEPGQYDVVNQVSGLHKISELAEIVAKVGKKYGFRVKIQRLINPRIEAENHPLEVISSKLPERGFKPKIPLAEEIENIFSLLTKPHILKRIKKYKRTVMPKTRWDITKKISERIEIYDPGTKKKKGYQGKLLKK